MRRILWNAASILPLLFFIGCEDNSPLSIAIYPPSCDIVSIEKKDGAYAVFTKDIITVKNTGDHSTAYNVSCTIDVFNGSTIIDSGSGFLGTLDPGISSIDDVFFSRISSHSEYQRAKITMYWEDAAGNCYSKTVER